VPASTVFGTAVSTTWTNFDLASLWPGFQLGARTGLRIAIRSLKFDGVLQGGQAQSALDDLYNRFRIVIAKWNSNAFGGATVWPTQNGWTVDSGIHRKWNDCGLMKVYMDRRFVLEPLLDEAAAGDGYVPNSYRVRFRLVFRKPLVLNWPQLGAPVAVDYMPHYLINSVSDSGAAPSPGFVSGQLLIRWRNLP